MTHNLNISVEHVISEEENNKNIDKLNVVINDKEKIINNLDTNDYVIKTEEFENIGYEITNNIDDKTIDELDSIINNIMTKN